MGQRKQLVHRCHYGLYGNGGFGRRAEAAFPDRLRKSGKGSEKYADPEEGLWHTVINDSSSYIELSASAGFLCGMMKGIRKGVISKGRVWRYRTKALSHLLDYIDEKGVVKNVSYGTPIGENAEFHKNDMSVPMTCGPGDDDYGTAGNVRYTTER